MWRGGLFFLDLLQHTIVMRLVSREVPIYDESGQPMVDEMVRY